MTYFKTLSTVGFAATAISYGPGRMGFGLFVPDMKSDIGMTASTVGLVSSLGFLGFFLALLLAQAMLTRYGPKAPVVTGLLSATGGMALVAGATTVPLLAVGIFFAAASAGFAWSPFNDAVNRKIESIDRPAALSRISSGTSFGIVLAAAAAFAAQSAGVSWRVCWAAFAAASAAALVVNWVGLRTVPPADHMVSLDEKRLLGARRAMPLYAVALALGLISAIYAAFAADHIKDTGPLPGLSAGIGPAALFLFYGFFGLAGLVTEKVRDQLGLLLLLRVLMLTGAMSFVAIVLWPNMWIALILSAGAQGTAVMMTSAILAFWSDRLFPGLPSMAFTAALLAYAAGSIIGPALAGMASDAFGANAMFVGVAVLPAMVALGLSDRLVRETPVEDVRPEDNQWGESTA